MDPGGVGKTTGLLSPFEQLSDDLLLRILVLAAQTGQDDVSFFGSEYGAVDTASSGIFAALEKLCQLRLVCRRFDHLIPQAERVSWWADAGQVMSPWGIRFLQQSQALQCIRLSRPAQTAANDMPLALLMAAQAKPHLEMFEVSGANISQKYPDDEQTHFLFSVLSTCPKLRVLRLLRCSADLYRPLSQRHVMRSLRTLELEYVFLSDACVSTIFSACPSLENLAIEEVEQLESPVIKSRTLRRLSIASECGIAVLTLLTPELRYLEAYACEKMVVDAPLLNHLVLGDDWNILKQAPWQVSVLDIAYAFEPVGKLSALFTLCPDLKNLAMRPATSLARHQGPPIPKVMLSELLATLPHLESLDIPHNLAGVVDLQRDAVLLAPVAKLQHLRIGFENMPKKVLESVTELMKGTPVLKSIRIDLQTLNLDPRISALSVDMDALFSGFMRFQKKYSHLEINVQWPRRCCFEC